MALAQCIIAMLVGVFLVVMIQPQQSCPENCRCKTFSSECTITWQEDELDLFADYIIIKGRLFPVHYMQLYVKSDMVKELHGSPCRTLENCE